MRQVIRLVRYVLPFLPQLLPGIFLLAAVGFLEAFRLVLLKPVLDRVLNPSSGSDNITLFTMPQTGQPIYLQRFVPTHFHNAWTMVAYALVASTVLKGCFDYLGTYLVNHAGFGMITSLRNDLYNSVLRRSAAFFQKHTTGTLISTIINDIERVQFAMSSILAEFLQQFFTFLFTAGLVIVLGKQLAWVLLIFIPIIIFSAVRIGRRVRSTTRTGQDQLADVQNILHETITGNRIVKAFGMESWEVARFRNAAQRLFRANLRSVAAAAISSPLMDIFGAVAIALLLLLGRQQIKNHELTLGAFIAFVAAVLSMYNPVRKFAVFNNGFQQALGASSQLFTQINTGAYQGELFRGAKGAAASLDPDDLVIENPAAKALPRFSQCIRFEDVSFSYQSDGEDSREILHNINLEVKRGEILAFVGSSGAGKSTLVHLLPRFFDVSAGSIRIDTHDVRDVTLSSLRSQIGIVTQDTVLFNDTVRNNIAYGQPHVPLKEVEAAARAALAHDFIQAL